MSENSSDEREEVNDMSMLNSEGLEDVTLERGIDTEDMVIDSGIEVDENLINMFLEFTGSTDREVARNYIESTDGDMERAAELFLTGMPPEPLVVQRPFTAASVDSVAQNLSSELEMLMRSAGENDTGINRLQELTQRFLRMSERGNGSGRSSRTNELFPKDSSLLLKFDSPKRIKEQIEKLRDPKMWNKLYELGNLAIYSKDTCEEILKNNIVEDILFETLDKTDSKEAERTIIRSLQVFEALSMSVFASFFEARERCARWFISPRRNAASSNPSMTFLNGLITISAPPNNSSSSRSHFTQQFLDKVLPTSDIEKLEHMWLSDKFDPHWRDKKTESELLSLSLYRGCSIKFLTRLVGLVRGCRACVNPELDRVGSLEKPIVLAARADFVTEDTDISSEAYPEEKGKKYSLAERRELWSHRACEILLDHGAKVSVILKNQEDITDSARKLFELELAAKRSSGRAKYLKTLQPVSEAVKTKFARELVPNFFQRVLFTLRNGSHGVRVKRRILDVLSTVVGILNKQQEYEVLKQLLFDTNVFKELSLLFLEIFDCKSSLEELKALAAHLVITFLVSKWPIGQDFKMNVESEVLIPEQPQDFQLYLAKKLYRFGIYDLLSKGGSKSSSTSVNTLISVFKQYLARKLVMNENSRILSITQLLKKHDVNGFKLLSEVLTEDPFEWSEREEFGITAFEFQQAQLCEILICFMEVAAPAQVESFFQYFQPPLNEIKDSEELLETKEGEEANTVNQEILADEVEQSAIENNESLQDVSRISVGLHQVDTSKENALYNLMLLIQQSLGKNFLCFEKASITATSVKTLIKVWNLKLRNVRYPKGSMILRALPITPMLEVEHQIIRSWLPEHPEYITFCFNLVGHRIKLRSKYDNTSEFDLADVLLYDQKLNAHVVNIFSIANKTFEKTMLNLLLFDYEIVAKLTKKENEVNSEKYELPVPDFVSHSKYRPGDSVYIWFSGEGSFRDLCFDSDSNFTTEEDTSYKVSKFYKPGWYSAEVVEVNESGSEFVYTVKYLETDFQRDKLIREKCIVKLKPDILAKKEFSGISAEDTARVYCLERGFLITSRFKEKALKISDVEKQFSPVNTHAAPIFESNVSAIRLFTEEEVYASREENAFSVYLKLKPKFQVSSENKAAFTLNQRIKARWGSRSKYYNGFISRVNLDGTYDISYDDGDTERQVNAELITDFYTKPLPSIARVTSFAKIFPSSARKKLFDILRERDSVLSIQSKYTFMTRGFKDELEFETCFANSLAARQQGLFAKCQTYEQATILAGRLRQMSSIDLGIGFELQAVVEYEPDIEINPAAREEINAIFTKQWSAQPGDIKDKLRARILQKCQNEVNIDFIHPRDRVQALVEVESEESGKENIWLPATVLLKEKGLLTVVLDNGTVVDCLTNFQVRTQRDLKTKISFQSSERSKPMSPTKQVASPIGRRRKKKVSDEEWAQATQSLVPTRSTLFADIPENVLSDSNLEVVFSDEMGCEDHLSEMNQIQRASNKPSTTALTRKFTAFGESLSYKHISANSHSDEEETIVDELPEVSEDTITLSVPRVEVVFWIKQEGEYKRYTSAEFREMSVKKFCTLTKDSETIHFSVEVNSVEKVNTFPCSKRADTANIDFELRLLSWLKEYLTLQSMGETSLKGAYDTSLPWKNLVLNDMMKTALSDALSVTTLDFPVWPKFMAENYSFLIQEKVRENMIRYFDLGTSRAVAYLQDKTPGYLSKKKKLVQATLELSTLFTGANPDILRYEQLQSRCEKLDLEIKQMENEHFIGKLNEDLVKVSRESLLDDAYDVIKRHKNSRSRMIVQFLGENSSGDGVTTDFYTSVAVELQKRKANNMIPLFVDLKLNQDSDDIEFAADGLFIQPLAPCGGTKNYEEGEQRNKDIIERYYFLGLLFGKAFLDGHRIPLPLSTEFFDAVIGFHQDPQNFAFTEDIIDKVEGSEQHDDSASKNGVIRTLISLYEKKDMKELESLLSELSLIFVDISQPFFPKGSHTKESSSISKAVESKEEEASKPELPEFSILSTEQNQLDEFATKASKQGCSQEDIEQKLIEIGATKVQVWKALGVSQHIRNKLAMAKAVANVATHIVVGEFVVDGTTKTVDVENVGEYLTLIKKWWLRDGVVKQLESFLNGLKEILQADALSGLMKSFTGVELKHLFCGTEDITWDDKDPLLGIIVPSGEYNANSKPIKQLVSILKEMSTKERSLFLNFATAQPRVPTSGLPKIKVYPPLMERTLGIKLGFAVSALATDAELRALETAVRPFVPGLFQEGDIVQVKTTGSVTSAVVQSWSESDRKILFKGEPRGWFQTGQLLRMNPEFAAVLKKFKAEIAIKKVIELPAVVQCKPYLRPKATTCAKTIYLPDGYRDEEHMLSIFREAFEDARLGGIHD